MKLDIIEESEWAESRMARSFHFDRRGEKMSMSGYQGQNGGDPVFVRKRQTVNFVDADGVNQDKALRAETPTAK